MLFACCREEVICAERERVTDRMSSVDVRDATRRGADTAVLEGATPAAHSDAVDGPPLTVPMQRHA